jgi:hypothetical protein
MKRIQFFIGCLLLIPLGFVLQGHSKAGGDHFTIYLNDKMVMEHYVLNKSSVGNISLAAANENDKLVIHYSHCGKVGSGRIISVKDENGKILKQWKFPDSKQTGMQLMVKEINKSASGNGSVSLHYTSQELNPGMKLAILNVVNGKTVKL